MDDGTDEKSTLDTSISRRFRFFADDFHGPTSLSTRSTRTSSRMTGGGGIRFGFLTARDRLFGPFEPALVDERPLPPRSDDPLDLPRS
ncbi:MAG: hypothetical protein GY939_20075 [Actinomycetia bacterium]|nr:hypothetical protein [Actinomycetes bacterium]